MWGLIVNADSLPVYISDDFRGATAPDWTFVTGQGDGPSLTGNGTIDPVGDGWLRLTNDTTNQSSFVYNHQQIIPSNLGVKVTFDFVIWRGSSGTPADGIVVALFDALTDQPSAGAYGGSLGYAQRTDVEGLAGAVVGVGIDEFGNFSRASEGRVGGPGQRAYSVAVRGPQGETRNEGYAYLTGTAANVATFATSNATSRGDATIYTTEITFTPEQTLTVRWMPGGDEWITLIDHYDFSEELLFPENVRIGFTSGTGTHHAFHEIRNLEVTAAIIPEISSLLLVCLAGRFSC